MDAQQFAYWLQGFAELTDKAPTDEQWQSIREHLALVFAKVTPPLRQFINPRDLLARDPVSPCVAPAVFQC